MTDLLTSGQAARILFVNPKTIKRWADDGKLAFTRTHGGHRRFKLEDIEAIRENGTRPQFVRIEGWVWHLDHGIVHAGRMKYLDGKGEAIYRRAG